MPEQVGLQVLGFQELGLANVAHVVMVVARRDRVIFGLVGFQVFQLGVVRVAGLPEVAFVFLMPLGLLLKFGVGAAHRVGGGLTTSEGIPLLEQEF